MKTEPCHMPSKAHISFKREEEGEENRERSYTITAATLLHPSSNPASSTFFLSLVQPPFAGRILPKEQCHRHCHKGTKEAPPPVLTKEEDLATAAATDFEQQQRLD
ncbi:hypothetical protein NE237_031657 [Protea cynaroides]|uniref:Uncharacterized protein n=1 Tax=Protea cynaroides TaxID=273540 RepID=A0A9Q0R2S7_9MAGN|nr:hypothetical protein NE237_031657 [Protea cynaroides]